MGVADVARKVKKMYIGVDGVARKVKKAYIGVDGVARLWWNGEVKQVVYGTVTATSKVTKLEIGSLGFQPKGVILQRMQSGDDLTIQFAYHLYNSPKEAGKTYPCVIVTSGRGSFAKDSSTGTVTGGEDFIAVSGAGSVNRYFQYKYQYVVWG